MPLIRFLKSKRTANAAGQNVIVPKTFEKYFFAFKILIKGTSLQNDGESLARTEPLEETSPQRKRNPAGNASTKVPSAYRSGNKTAPILAGINAV